MENDKPKDDVYNMLSESGYADKAIRYFQDQDNLGIIEGADHCSDLTGPCGDTMKITMNVKGGRIEDAKIQVMGCPGAVASGSATVALAKGRTLEEAESLTLDELYGELEKMPDQKVHCARLAIKTLQKAVIQYREEHSTQVANEN
ncbi:MAG: iron-sulfur cluster assembly scaffold protein [Deltaproteobacteria bacterium]|jgi:nitrogen fixation NifU-like protein|nr:iron-sulfur cluster assembly scaffold protein [Deltaproteobacteria bacterium]